MSYREDCEHCSATITKAAKYCPFCGRPVAPASTLRHDENMKLLASLGRADVWINNLLNEYANHRANGLDADLDDMTDEIDTAIDCLEDARDAVNALTSLPDRPDEDVTPDDVAPASPATPQTHDGGIDE